MSEARIARFVDMNACKSIFSEHSTFVLRSPVYYRRFYGEGGDERELRIRKADGGSAESSCLGVVLSCWTILDGDAPTAEEWNIFPNTVVAIISTPDRVCAMLKEAFEMESAGMRCGRRFPFKSVEHGTVAYADEVAEEIGFDNIWEKTVFTKRLRFAQEKEYRFVLPYTFEPHAIDSYIFIPHDPKDYMDNCFADPAMCREDKHNLYCILGNAMCGYRHFARKKMGEIIANADILLD